MKMRRSGFIMVILIAVVAVAFSGPAFAAKEKVAVVSVTTLFDEYDKTKELDSEFQAEGQLKQEERDAIIHEIKRLQDELAVLSEDAKADKESQIEEKEKELYAFDAEIRATLGRRRNEALSTVFEDIENTMQRYGERKGYDFILNDRALLYRSKQLDVTKEVLKELNQAYKKKK